MKKDIRIIGAASGWGAQIHGCERGPVALKEGGLLQRLVDSGMAIKGWDTLFPEISAQEIDLDLSETLPLVYDFNLRLADHVTKTLASDEFPLIIGGDHSIAVGTWNGVHQYLQKQGDLPLGLLWIDAHMDAHVPETTPSGAWHGMPVAGLLGFGDPKMAQLKGTDPVLAPENVCLIMSRSYETGELELLKKLGVKIYYMDEVKKRGIAPVFKEAFELISRNTKKIGVSLDLDCVDPKEAPGVGSPEEGGASASELLEALKTFRTKENLIAFEIVEYNPERNHLRQTAELCYQMIRAIL